MSDLFLHKLSCLFSHAYSSIKTHNMCRKRHSASSISPGQEISTSKFSEARLLYDGQNIQSPTNAALLLENIKQEVESIDAYHSQGTPARTQFASKRKPSIDSYGMSDMDAGVDSLRYSLKACKHEDESLADGGDTTFTLFASLLDSALQGA
jgi:nuclear pore complex protein Nup107